MRIVILTESNIGTAAHHLACIIAEQKHTLAMVIVSEHKVIDKKKQYVRKIKKIGNIGILGAMNGIRMRKWYSTDIQKYVKIEHLEVLCKQHNIPYHRVERTNSEITQQLFREAQADVGLSLGNGYIGKKIFSIPTYGMLNIHHEWLPDYQNAQSVIWQIYNGSKDSGYTIHKIDTHIDTGEILLQEKVPILFEDSLAETVAKTVVALMKASAKGLLTVLNDFDHYYKHSKPQGKGRSYTTPNIWQFWTIYKQFQKLKNS